MRKITNINSGWLFSKDAEKVPNVLPDNWQEVDLPHTWNGDDGQDGGNDYYRGTCYYAMELDGSLFDEGKVTYLEFRGVNSIAEIFFNGEKLITHHGGYSTFRVKIPQVKSSNLLVVAADNSPNDFVYPQVADFDSGVCFR